jgi:rhamnosyltransferase
VATPRASVLIPTLNAGPRFQATLDAIRRQQTMHSFEVVIVDSGSQDQTVELAQRSGAEVHSIPRQEFGHGRTRNLLARLAHGQWLVFLTQDAVPADESWLDRLLGCLGEPRIASCFGRQVPRSDASPLQVHHLSWWYPDRPSRWSLESSSDARISRLFYSHVNAACKREVWEAIPFEEALIMSEDQQWSRRVLLAGWEIAYRPDAVVIHSHDYGLAEAFKRHFDSGASLAMITTDTERDWFRLGLSYLGSEARFLWSHKSRRMLPYAMVYEAARYAGFRLGRQHRWIPRGLKARLGKHSMVWAAEPIAQSGRATTTNW